MSMLPPLGWADVATKHDIESLRMEMNALERGLEARLEAKLERSLRQQLHVIVFALIGAMATMTTVNLTAVALLR